MATKKDVQAQMALSIKQMENLNAIHKKYADASINQEDAISQRLEIQANKQRMINELKANFNQLSEGQKDQLTALNAEYEKEYDKLLEINNQLKKQAANQAEVNKKVEKYSQLLAKGWEYLMQSDKVIKETIKNLGMSGTKANEMRKSFELSAGHVARMGGGLADIQMIMTGYADETGRARVLSEQMAEDIAAIGLGTGLGVEQATKLGAQFELMGLDARRSMEMVQGIVDTSERMGVNTTKVLKNVTDNFKKLNTYTFQGGTKAIAEMAMNAEKMKVDMKDALSAADVAKSLEGAIDLAANLQIMGGEFAKTDPFEWMYLARNEPEKLTKKISEMTRGMVTFKKNSEGTFEKFISPADRERLASVAKSLGISAEEMTQITQRRAELDLMSRQLAGTGLTGREKELVEGAAVFNAKSGKFEVQLAGKMRDISTLTADQAKSFAKEQVLLKQRAENAQDFDAALKATIEELKSALLPMLQGINKVLAFIRPVAKAFADAIAWLSKSNIGQGLLIGAGALMAAGFLLNKVLLGFTSRGLGERIAGSLSGGVTEKTGGFSVRNLGRTAPKSRAAGLGKGLGGNANAGKGMMRGGAGIGAAAVGMGAGIGLAAAGISLLADSMSKLNKEQAEILLSIVKTLGWFIVGGAIAAAAVLMIGTAMGVAAPPMGAFALAALGIGAAVGIAAAGIGLMGMGLGKMLENAKGAGKDMLMIGGGIAAIAGSLALLNFAGLGLGVFAAVMGLVVAGSVATAVVAKNIEKMGTAMSGTKDDWIAVQNAITAIGKANFKGGGMIADLANLLKSPLKVEFANKELAVVSNITMEIDGEKFFQKTYRPTATVEKSVAAKLQGLFT